LDWPYLQGIGKLDEDQILILLDLDRIFSLDEYQAMAETVISEA
jgi:chemotaxis signal transduction protein